MIKQNNLLVNLSLSNISTTPFYVMPSGLLSLIAYLRENGVPSDLVDLNVVRRKNVGATDLKLVSIFEKQLIEDEPCLVGASVMVAGQFGLARDILKATKKHSPTIITVIGGAHVSQFSKEILENCPEIDFVVIGEGEQQLLACSHFAQTKTPPASWPDGIAYRSGTKVVVNDKVSYIDNVDTLPFPAYDVLNFNDYLHDTSTWHNPYQIDMGVRTPIITSRGCPNLSNFCSVAKCMGRFYRPMSSSKVVDMMQKLHEHNNVSTFVIYDSNFAQETQRVVDICNEITKRKLKFNLDLPTGLPINATAKEMIDALADAGLIRTCISIESGDFDIRNKAMKKNVELDDVFKVVEYIRHYPQIFILADFILGMPEDTVESVDASCRLIEEVDIDDIELSIATPYPGTNLFQQCEQENLFFGSIDKNSLWISDWYSHVNLDKFIIKPYALDLKMLQTYRIRILSMRAAKLSAYRKRMETFFNITSNYARERS